MSEYPTAGMFYILYLQFVPSLMMTVDVSAQADR